MLPYWLLYLYFAIGALTTALSSRELQPASPGDPATGAGGSSSKIPLNLAFLVGIIGVALMIGLRFEVGTDWYNYTAQFEATKRLSFSRAIVELDPAYGAINWLVVQVGAGIWLVNLACGSLFGYGLMCFARTQPNPWLVIAVAVPYLVIVVGMGYTRQAVAIGLGMVGLTELLKGSFVRFVLWVLAASLFHRSAVILIPIVALTYTRNSLQTFVLGLLGSAIGYYVLARMEGIEHFQQLYITRRQDSAGALIRLAMNFFPALIYLGQTRRFSNVVQARRLWLIFALLGIVSAIAWLFVPSTTPLDRLALYIIPLQLFVLGSLPRAFARDNQAALTVLVLLYSATVQLVWLSSAANRMQWLPYALYPVG